MAKYRVRLTNKKLALIAIVVLSALVLIYWFRSSPTSHIVYVYNYKGQLIYFRANLTEAFNVPVYPSEKALFDAVMNERVKRINIVFVNSSDNSLVAVNGFEVSSKLSLVFYLNNMTKKIKGLEVASYNVTGTEDTLVVALIPPALANKTEVWLEDHAIFISGKTSKEFDLATVRFLLSVMEVVA